MKKLLLIGQLNDNLKELNSFLSKHFQVQLSSQAPAVLFGMLDVFLPDIMVISLVGLQNMDVSVMRHISTKYHSVPVVTIGTEYERESFLQYYEDEQFTNIIRPTSNARILELIRQRLGSIPEQEPETEKKTVMVVDDDASVLRTVKRMLEDKYNVVIAPSGTKAMTLIGRSKPDVILLDYEMPVIDGRQTLEMIRSDDELKDIPVIFLTGVNDSEHIRAVLELKPSGYLLKPADKTRLTETINSALS